MKITDCEELDRVAFEHWFSDNGENPKAIERPGDVYKLMQTQAAWVAWSAAVKVERAHSAIGPQSEVEAVERLCIELAVERSEVAL